MDPRTHAGGAEAPPAGGDQPLPIDHCAPLGPDARPAPGHRQPDPVHGPPVRTGRVTASPPSPAGPARVILDCDPGIDDALAIAFACGHPGLDPAGLTTVSGNVDLAKVTR